MCSDNPGILWRRKTISKTRTVHKCYDCGNEIPIGSKIRRFALLDDDRKWTNYHYCCNPCRPDDEEGPMFEPWLSG